MSRIAILIPLDGSEMGEQALEKGLDLYDRSSLEIYLLHCMESKEILYYTSRLPAHVVSELLENERKYHQDYIDRQVARLKAQGYTCQGILKQGDPVEKILAAAKEHSCDQIVLTTHGRRGVARLFMGSVTEGVLRRAQMPVLVIPSSAR